MSEHLDADAGRVQSLTWSDGAAVALRCPVCGHVEGQTLIATASVPWQDDPVDVARCAQCRAIVMSAVEPAADFFDEDVWDKYVESTAGLGIIAGILSTAGRVNGSTMLDVGCGYGFALDLGSFLFGWRGVGLDPSIAAERGRVDLGLDIRTGYLDTAFDAGDVFDVVLASEVLEHVPDPRAFVAALANRLAPDGLLLLTTPDAAIVRPETDHSVLLPALALGAHAFLLDAPALGQLLADAGLEAEVWTEGPGLRAVAARSRDALAGAAVAAEPSYVDLARYCDDRADKAASGSVLQVGMAARHLEYTVNLGDLAAARSAVPRLRTALLERYGVDIDEPAAPPTREASGVLVGVHYFLGILELNGTGAPERAAEYFAASARAARVVYEEHDEYWSPQVPALEFIALGNRPVALATARARRRAVNAALADLDDAVRRGLGDAAAAAAFRERTREIQATLRRETLHGMARGRLPG